MSYRILTVNPGSTSTKIAVFEDEEQILSTSITHSTEDLSGFHDVLEQHRYRTDLVLDFLAHHGIDPSSFSAVVGRGGLLPPVEAGAYLINDKMIEDLKRPGATHASNLGAMIADEIARPLGIPAYIYDAVTSDELSDVARVTGFPEVTRHSASHVLNSKAMCRRYAQGIGKKYEDIKVIVAHLGGGISITVHEDGRIVDVEGDDEGPFCPERSGAAPLLYIVDMCYSGKYDKASMLRKIRGSGGLKAHLGTSDLREIEKMIADGDEHAKLIYEAQIYQILKGIGMMLPLLDRLDAVILTGGLAYSEKLTSKITKRLERFVPVVILPGENEMDSLALGGLRVLRGEETAKVYGD